jgi:hypothetical protein
VVGVANGGRLLISLKVEEKKHAVAIEESVEGDGK